MRTPTGEERAVVDLWAALGSTTVWRPNVGVVLGPGDEIIAEGNLQYTLFEPATDKTTTVLTLR